MIIHPLTSLPKVLFRLGCQYVPTISQNPGQDVEILTCSTAADLELFAPLAASIDRHVDEDVHHTVIVPQADLPRFKALASERRTIIPQEDVLPFKRYKSPDVLKKLSGLRAGFRRPFYFNARGQIVRGWMLQQFLKIEMARRSTAAAVMHVDSDVCFVRPFSAADAFSSGFVTIFQVDGITRNPKHREWVEGSCKFLGMPAPSEHNIHYIENCVLWSTDVARAMIERIETTQGKPIVDVIFGASTMSEYYLYGLFCHLFPDEAPLAPENVSYCNSFWPSSNNEGVAAEAFLNRVRPKHRAIAVQSTHKLDIADRLALYETVEANLATK
jgi:hypothetical protein